MAKKEDKEAKDPKAAELKARMDKLKMSLLKIEKDYGKGTIMCCGSEGRIAIPVISTGAFSLDLALGIGGIPRGRITEIFGPEASGKSSLCHHIMANAQKTGGLVALIDTEHALDASWAAVCGVNLKSLYVSQPSCAEEALGITGELVASDTLDVVVIDSVAALVPKAELDGEFGDSHMGLQARLMSQAMRKLTSVIGKSRTAVIFTNQMRMKIGVMFGNPETTTGGNALKFYASVRLDIRRQEAIKDASGQEIGNEVKVKVVKNKLAPPFRVARFNLMHATGIDWAGSVLSVAEEKGVVEKRGAWYSYGGEQLGQGAPATAEGLRANPELMRKIEEAVRQSAVSLKAEVSDEAEPADDSAGEAGGEVPPAAAE
jgi:recombination protein RecA